MHRRPPLSTAALIVAAILAGRAPAEADGILVPGKTPVIVAPGEVTINGISRPDLGRSFSDTITSNLLRTGSYSIIEPALPPSVHAVAAGSMGNLPQPSPVPETVGADSGAQYAFVPRMVVEEDYQKLAIKKIRISDGEVLSIYEKNAISLDRSAMFELLDDTVRLVVADVARDRATNARAARQLAKLAATEEAAEARSIDPDPDPPVAPGEIPIPDPPRVLTPELQRAAAAAPPTSEIPEALPPAEAGEVAAGPEEGAVPPDAPEAIVEYAGRVRNVNPELNFCIVETAQRGMLEIDDELLVRPNDSLKPLGKLRVTKVNGSTIVADGVGDLHLARIQGGFKVYRWVPEPAADE